VSPNRVCPEEWGPKSAFWTRIGTDSYGFDWPGGATRSSGAGVATIKEQMR